MSSLPKRERVPDYHYESKQSKALLEVLESAALDVAATLKDVEAQFFVATATWGLSLWEQQVGIDADTTLPYEDRRAAVFTKMARQGHTTAEEIAGLVTQLTGYKVSVLMTSGYTFTVDFTDTGSGLVPIDRQAILAAIDEIKPAHLLCVIAAVTWAAVETSVQSWQYFEDSRLTWADIENAVYV